MGMSLRKPGEMVKDREDWHAAVHAVAESDMNERLNTTNKYKHYSIERPRLQDSGILKLILAKCIDSFKQPFSQQFH